ncbi:hypothetical protein GCM10022200_11300 [Microbacterium awajiense]|uniref:Uncharacterized protein n=1 Tax=Microbacterium awajiense TaxID=415214 RepID=A0ABP7AEG3_9MICO
MARAQLGGLVAQLFVGELLVILFEGADRLHDLLEPPEQAALTGTQKFLERVGHGVSPSVGLRGGRSADPAHAVGRPTGIPAYVIHP